MSWKLLDNIDLGGGQLFNVAVQQLGSDPAGFEGQIWELTTTHKLKAYLNGAITIVRTTDTPITDTDVAAANKDGVVGTASMRTIGTGAQQAMAGNTTLATIAAPGADVSLNTHKITNVVDGTNPQDVATVNQLTTAIAGLDVKPSARAAALVNINIANPGTAVFDGVTLTSGQRLLLPNQTAPAENGVYVFTASGSALTRALDFDTWAEIPGSLIAVEEGTAMTAGGGGGYRDAVVLATADQGGTLNTTSVTFSKMNSPAAGVAKFAADITGNGVLTAFTVTHNLGTTDVVVSVRDVTADEEVGTLVKHPTTNTVTINVAQPVANLKVYRVTVIG